MDCKVTLKDRKLSSELRKNLGLNNIRNCIKNDGLRWFGHVERCSDDSVVKKWRDTYLLRVHLGRIGSKSRVVI